MFEWSFDNEYCFERIFKNSFCVRSTILGGWFTWMTEQQQQLEWLGVCLASGTSETKIMLGLLLSLCLSLFVGHILPLTDVLPLFGESRRSQPTGCFSLVTPMGRGSISLCQWPYTISQRRILISLGWVTCPFLDKAWCPRRLVTGQSWVTCYFCD